MRDPATITRDLVQDARAGKLPPVAGRDRLCREILKLLYGKPGKSVLIVGEPGIGKTSILHRVAQLAMQEFGPRGAALIELNSNLLVSGADVELDTQGVIKMLKSAPNGVLVVDGARLLFAGSLDSRGTSTFRRIVGEAAKTHEITVLCTLTPKEYVECQHTASMVMASFEVVTLPPMDVEHTREVLMEMLPHLEQRHGFPASRKVINAALSLGMRFVKDCMLPGGVIEIVDQAFSRYEHKTAIKEHHPDMADMSSMRFLRPEVGPYDVVRTVEELAGVDIKSKALELKNRAAVQMRHALPGMDNAIRDMVDLAVDIRLGFTDPYRPAGVMLFWGPAGGNKSPAARLLPQAVFGEQTAPFVFNLGDFTTPGTAARLFGPNGEGNPPGIADIARHTAKRSVVVLRHLERTNPEAMRPMIPILKTGWLKRDGAEAIDCRKLLFIFTLDCEKPKSSAPVGPEVGTLLAKSIGPDFMRVVDLAVPFAI